MGKTDWKDLFSQMPLAPDVKGVHWEKCHTLYYIKKGTITFDALEKVEVINFRKL